MTAWSFSSSRDHRPAGVGREDLGRLEVLAGERALARAAGADQDDEGELGDLDVHRDARPSSAKTRHLRRRPERLRPPARPAGTAPRSRTDRRRPRPRPGTRPGSTRSGGRGGGASRPPTFSQVTLYSAVGRRQHDRPGPGELEDGPLEGREPGRVEVLDHLDHGGGVEPLQAPVAVDQRPVDQLEAGGLRLGHPVELEPVSGGFEGADRHVHADDLLELPVLEQFPEQLALAAAEVEHPPRPRWPGSPPAPPRAAARSGSTAAPGRPRPVGGRPRPPRLRAAAPRRRAGRGPAR